MPLRRLRPGVTGTRRRQTASHGRRSTRLNRGLTGLAGVSFPLTAAVQNFIELKYHHLTDAKQLKFNWGIAFNL